MYLALAFGCAGGFADLLTRLFGLFAKWLRCYVLFDCCVDWCLVWFAYMVTLYWLML